MCSNGFGWKGGVWWFGFLLLVGVLLVVAAMAGVEEDGTIAVEARRDLKEEENVESNLVAFPVFHVMHVCLDV